MTRLYTVLMLAAGCGTEAPTHTAPTQLVPLSDRAPRSTVDATQAAPHANLYGTLDCGPPDHWMLYAWRLGSTDPRGPDGVPTAPPDLAVPVESPGHWSLPIAEGPRRLLVAQSVSTGALATTDPHMRAFPVNFDLEGLDLTCVDAYTPAADGSTATSQGSPVLEDIVQETTPGIALSDTPLGRARTSRMYNAARRGEVPGAHTEAAVRDRYKGQINDDHLRAMMPLLVQLSDDPEAADQLVATTRKQLSGPTGASASPRSGHAPVGLIEIKPGTWEASGSHR